MKILFAILTLNMAHSITPPCQTKCSQVIKLSPPQFTPVNITDRVHEATLYKAPLHVAGFIITLKRWRMICKQALSRDPLASCTSSEEMVDIPVSMSQAILSKKKCPIGPICDAEIEDCFGGGFSHCDDGVPLTTWVEGRKFQLKGSRSLKIFRWSCVQDWECSIKAVQFPILLKGSEKDGINPFSTSYNGELFKLSKEESIVHHSSDHHNHIVPRVEVEVYPKEKANCISEKERAACVILPSKMVNYAITTIDKEGFGFYDNLAVHIQSLSGDRSGTEMNKLGDTASIGDLIKIINSLMYSQLQSHYNSINIAVALKQTQDIIYKAIKSLSKTSPSLLPSLLSMNGTTTWIGHDNPVICPCVEPPTEEKMCEGNYKWEGGIPKLIEKSHECKSPSHNSSVPFIQIQIFPNSTMDTFLIPELHFETSIKDQSDRLPDGPEDDNHPKWSDTNQGIEILKFLRDIWIEAKSWFLIIGSFLGWLSFLPYVFTCFRKP